MLQELSNDCIYCILECLDECSIFSFPRINKYLHHICIHYLFPALCSSLLIQRHGYRVLSWEQNVAPQMLQRMYRLNWNPLFIPPKCIMEGYTVSVLNSDEWICLPTMTCFSTAKQCHGNYYFSIQIDHLEQEAEEDSCGNLVIGFITHSMKQWMNCPSNDSTEKGDSFGFVCSNGFKMDSKHHLFELCDSPPRSIRAKDIVTVVVEGKEDGISISYRMNERNLGVVFLLPNSSEEKDWIIPAISIRGTVQVSLLPFSKIKYQQFFTLS